MHREENHQTLIPMLAAAAMWTAPDGRQAARRSGSKPDYLGPKKRRIRKEKRKAAQSSRRRNR